MYNGLMVNEDDKLVYCNRKKGCLLDTGKGDPVALQVIRKGVIQ